MARQIAIDSWLARVVENKPVDDMKKGVRQDSPARAGESPSIIDAHSDANRLALPTTLSPRSVSIDFSSVFISFARSASSVM